ncbi:MULTISPECIES: hypothetical protein [Bacillaceae]|uniref:hypothetical protein n=1 Tax=Bacillaceae TaxID=186817 RepID=UPI0005A41CBB|nr:hypothetical protein [Caldibacillus thermoamylovorans]KIO64278.1 hypothetical protein B4065_2746 [Caldibacillus thermoamylovorans]
MTTIVTLKSIKNGVHKIEVKREFGSIERRELTIAELKEYLEQTKQYCEHKGYEFIYNGAKISRPEAYAGFDETDFEVMDYELDSLYSQAKNAGKEWIFNSF